jgi:hypothetical protein
MKRLGSSAKFAVSRTTTQLEDFLVPGSNIQEQLRILAILDQELDARLALAIVALERSARISNPKHASSLLMSLYSRPRIAVNARRASYFAYTIPGVN